MKEGLKHTPLFSLYLCHKIILMASYSLNIDNLIEYLTGQYTQGRYMHSWLGIKDQRAKDVAQVAYDIVWDEIEKAEEGKEDFNAIKVLLDLFKQAKENGYSDTELVHYLYWGFSEIDAYINPAMEIVFEEERGLQNDISIN